MLTAKKVKKRFRLLLVQLLLVLSFSLSRTAFAVDYIFNHHTQQQAISQFNLRAIFTSRMRRWPDGTPVKLVTYNYDNTIFIDVCSQMNIYPINFKRVWDMVIYSGGGEGPIFVNNREEMIKAVSSTPGAIGYLESVKKGDEINVLQIN